MPTALPSEMRALTRAVHEEGGKICLQLVHCGGQTSAKIIGSRPVAPSAVEVKQYPELPAELSLATSQELIAFSAQGRHGPGNTVSMRCSSMPPMAT